MANEFEDFVNLTKGLTRINHDSEANRLLAAIRRFQQDNLIIGRDIIQKEGIEEVAKALKCIYGK